MGDEICVVVETLHGAVTELSYTMLAAGHHLAEGLKAKLCALLIGHQVQNLTGMLGVADHVLSVDDASLAEFNPEAFLRVVAGVFERGLPRVAIFGHSAMGTDIACGVAQRLKLPIVVSCRTLSGDRGTPQYLSLICGGKIIAEGPLPGPSCLVTLMSGGYKADEGKVAGAPPVETVPAPAGLDSVRTRFKEYIPPPAGDVDIAKQPILVSIGRGIQTKDNSALAEELAKALGGVVSGSRPVIDQGWLPSSRLVGKSGKQVKPKLYLAMGISGAPEHMEGVLDAGTMISVNTDEKAPIFNVAHYGATCDAVKLMPVLVETLRKS